MRPSGYKTSNRPWEQLQFETPATITWSVWAYSFTAGIPHGFKKHFPYFFNTTLKKFNTIIYIYFPEILFADHDVENIYRTVIRGMEQNQYKQMIEFSISILFQYFMHISANFNTVSRSWKSISQFNTFSIPRGNPKKNTPRPLNKSIASIFKPASANAVRCSPRAVLFVEAPLHVRHVFLLLEDFVAVVPDLKLGVRHILGLVNSTCKDSIGWMGFGSGVKRNFWLHAMCACAEWYSAY